MPQMARPFYVPHFRYSNILRLLSQFAVAPPSTVHAAPLTMSPSPEQRNRTSLATLAVSIYGMAPSGTIEIFSIRAICDGFHSFFNAVVVVNFSNHRTTYNSFSWLPILPCWIQFPWMKRRYLCAWRLPWLRCMWCLPLVHRTQLYSLWDLWAHA